MVWEKFEEVWVREDVVKRLLSFFSVFCFQFSVFLFLVFLSFNLVLVVLIMWRLVMVVVKGG